VENTCPLQRAPGPSQVEKLAGGSRFSETAPPGKSISWRNPGQQKIGQDLADNARAIGEGGSYRRFSEPAPPGGPAATVGKSSKGDRQDKTRSENLAGDNSSGTDEKFAWIRKKSIGKESARRVGRTLRGLIHPRFTISGKDNPNSHTVQSYTPGPLPAPAPGAAVSASWFPWALDHFPVPYNYGTTVSTVQNRLPFNYGR